jgi:hypothetical protein
MRSTPVTEFALTADEERTEEEIKASVRYLSPDNKEALHSLLAMHTYKRPHNSGTEKRFINRFIIPLGVKKDAYGNFFKWIDNPDGSKPTIMWSCHTDTVHDRKGMLEIGYDKDEIGVSEKDKSNCLGADDGAGCWLMREQILARVPGLYLFHRNEEHGRVGSMHFAKNYAKDLEPIKFCIALDRKAEGSIITFQSGGRCCSEIFSKSIAAQLKAGGLDYKSDPTGSFTDSASYTDIIGECTNLSVGYRNAHQHLERLDLAYVFRLRDALIGMDQSKLESSRKPGEKENRTYYGGSGTSYNYQDNRVSIFTAADGREYCYRNSKKYWVTLDPKELEYAQDDEWGFAYGGEAGYVPANSACSSTALQVVGTKSGTQVGTGVTPGADDAALINTGKTVAQQLKEHAEAKFDKMMEEREKLNKIMPNVVADGEDDDLDLPPSDTEFKLMIRMVERNADIVADLLEQMGYGYKDLCDEIEGAVGVVNY